MKKLHTQSIAKYKFSYQSKLEPASKAVASAYHLIIAPLLHCFILTTVSKSPDLPSSYSLLFISGQQRKIFEYEVIILPEMFENKLLPTVEYESEKSCLDLISQHGYSIVSESPQSIEVRLKSHGLMDIQPQILALLNPSAIATLKQLQLGVVPKIYNWLAEVSAEQFERRTLALLSYPILLVPILSPTIFEMFPPMLSEGKLKLDANSIERKITYHIDQGMPVEDILKSTLFIPEELLNEVKGKRFWDATPELEPRVHAHFKNEIIAYEYLSTF
jgi:hypothetical protein